MSDLERRKDFRARIAELENANAEHDTLRLEGLARIAELEAKIRTRSHELATAVNEKTAAVLAEREEFKHFIAEANVPDEVRRDLYRRIRARPAP